MSSSDLDNSLSPETAQLRSAVCTHCGCVCDDLTATIEDQRITRIENACSLSEEWFLAQTATPDLRFEIEGQSVSPEEAIEKTADILGQAQSPLIHGLARSSTPGQRAAVELADRIGAIIDTSASMCHAPSILAFQRVGESTCTLGEVRNRSDLVIFWGSNPVESHPRHLERYSGDVAGLFVPHGRSDRTLVVVDTQETETSDAADLFLKIEPESAFDVLWTLRSLLAGKTVTDARVGGIAIEQLQALAEKMRGCQFGAAFFGLGLARGPLGHQNVEALLQLVTDANDHTRFIARRMRNYGDVAGADSVLCWQTGYPFSVNLSRGYPRYNPGEFSAFDLLARGDVDAAFLIGSDGLNKIPDAALDFLRQIPTIYLAPADTEPPFVPTVRLTSGTYGIHDYGTAYRMDEVPIPLKPIFANEVPMDETLIQSVLEILP
ncbi:MAG: formylmethanofuran dehydrogenase subunit B [Planctomycetaceae bacterium]|nr:formylmethanofuran dehydrogenase subunit B [Planctomycetaceae bacterium]